MDGANGQTGRKNSSTTFVMTAFISCGLCNIFAHGKYFLHSAYLSHFPPPNTISLPSGVRSRIARLGQDWTRTHRHLQFPPTNSLQVGKFLGGTSTS
jgi:hypothetical protein